MHMHLCLTIIVVASLSTDCEAVAEWVGIADCIPRVTNTEAVVMEGRVVLGGRGLSSDDGRLWELETANLHNGGDNAVVVYSNMLWSFGGGGPDPLSATAEVWYSSDGLNWQEPSKRYEAPWGPRTQLSAVVFDGYMWVMGGVFQECVIDKKCDVFLPSYHGDVWRSQNGKDWELVTNSAGWMPRASLRSVVFQDKIWVVGGIKDVWPGGIDYLNDVWYSEDGVTWTEAVANAPWVAREEHTLTVHDDKLWLIGGYGKGKGPLADVWYSSDGVEWVLHTAVAPFQRRYSHAAVSFNGELLVIGGGIRPANFGESIYRDVWALTTTAPPVETPVWHSADQDQDLAISLSELLRVIQFYNFRVLSPAFHCNCETEDGYAPQDGVISCQPHASDYNPQDWRVELNELLRLIQFFNGGGYHACPDAASEDGFCVGAG